MTVTTTDILPEGYEATVTGSGVIFSKEPGGQAVVLSTVSTTVNIGPYNAPKQLILQSTTNDALTFTKSKFAIDDDSVNIDGGTINDVDITNGTLNAPSITGAPTTTVSLGTAATGVTAVEYGDGIRHTTVLTISTTLPAITGGAAEAEGVLIYTLPSGACTIERAYMAMTITQSEGNITADTPDVGLGTGQATGANATLDADATYEDILTGQTAADCDGSETIKTVANQPVAIDAADAHTVYFNVADTWAASGDTGAAVTGTVVLVWNKLA